jgi:hypothetical protein
MASCWRSTREARCALHSQGGGLRVHDTCRTGNRATRPLLGWQRIELAEAVVDLPEYLRFGVPRPAAKAMLAAGNGTR